MVSHWVSFTCDHFPTFQLWGNFGKTVSDPYPKVSERDYPGSSVVKILPSNAGDASSIPVKGAKIPCASWPKNQNIKQKQYYNKFNKDFKKSLRSIHFFCLLLGILYRSGNQSGSNSRLLPFIDLGPVPCHGTAGAYPVNRNHPSLFYGSGEPAHESPSIGPGAQQVFSHRGTSFLLLQCLLLHNKPLSGSGLVNFTQITTRLFAYGSAI